MKVEYHDLSQHVYELYDFFDIYCYDIFKTLKLYDNEIAVLLVFPTDSQTSEYDIQIRRTVEFDENTEKIVKVIKMIAEEYARSSEETEFIKIFEKYKNELEKHVDVIRIFNVSEYDESYILRIFPKT